MEESRPTDRGSVLLGFLLLVPLHVAGQGAVFAIGELASSDVGLVSLAVIGLSQLVYAVPAAVIATRRGAGPIAKGLWIGAAVTFLLNAACFGLMMTSGPW